ncbi:MAG: sodium:proline symporter [Bacteroidetes bacterium]|nr:sodium:proline symporter [Bacteroidota bacterium]
MSLSTSDIWVIAIYFLFTLWIGFRFSKKAGKGIESFFLGGRNLPWYLAGISMVATTFAADTPLAVTELVAKEGIAGNWLWWNFAFGGLLTTFFFSKLWRRSGVLTEVELIEFRYSGKPAAILRGFKAIYLGLIMNVMIIAWVNRALMTLFVVFFGLTETQAFWYTGIAMFMVMGYVSLSGLLGVVFTDVIQFFVAMAGCIILAVLVLNSDQVGGMENLKENLPKGTLNFLPLLDSSGMPRADQLVLIPAAFLAYIGFMWWSSWYPGQEPGGGGYVAQRMMSTKNEKHAIYATLFFNIAHYCLRPWPWIIVALCSVVLYPELSQSDPKAGYVMAMKDFLPDGLRGLLLVAFLSAYMSTISTQLNWGASYLVNDFYLRFIPGAKDESEKKKVRVSRLMTIGLMLIGLYSTTFVTRIEEVWKFIMECGAGLGLVLILRWYWWRINAWSEITATITPFVTYGVLYGIRTHLENLVPDLQGQDPAVLVQSEHPWLYFPYSFFIILTSSTIVWLLVTYFTKPVDENHLIKFYEKVKPGGWWKPVADKLESRLELPNLGVQALSWLLAVGFTYGFLFFSGKLILGYYDEAWKLGLFTAACLGLFLSLLKRSKLFD